MYILIFKISELFNGTLFTVLIISVLFIFWANFRRKRRLPKTSLLNAASNRDLAKFKEELAKRKVDVNQIDISRNSPLILATINFGHKYLIEELIAKGAFVNWPNINGNTALHYAVLQKKKALVKIFIEADADINLKNEEEKTPLDIARDKGLTDIISILGKE